MVACRGMVSGRTILEINTLENGKAIKLMGMESTLQMLVIIRVHLLLFRQLRKVCEAWIGSLAFQKWG
jgi:hypothetical protein